jgi:hypothetical protein
MDTKEIRIKCLQYAFQYIEYYAKMKGITINKTEYGVISIAKQFEEYIKGE